jgi:Zn finger protein HypA/HybF involved in hydrogenase expression
MSELRFGWFTVRSECPHCGQPLPLNGPAQHVSCAHCLRDVRVPDDIWMTVLNAFENGRDAMAVGTRSVGNAVVDGLQVRFEYAHGAPTCEKCGTQYPLDSLHVHTDQDFVCSKCGDPGSTYAAPDWLRQLVPTARQLFSTEPGAGDGEQGALELARVASALKPVVMACPQCGGALKATAESQRILPCQYCQGEIYLPDAVWRRLHPVKTVTPFFARFQGRTAAELEREERERAAREASLQKQQQAQRDTAQRQRWERDTRERERQEEAQEAADLHAAITRLKFGAWVTTAIACAFIGMFAGWAWIARSIGMDPSGAGSTVTFILGGAALLAVLVAMYMVGRPIQKRAGHAGEWLLFVTWFWLPFALAMPVVGQLMALVRVFVLLRGKIGSASITTNNTSTVHYGEVVLPEGEGYPAALLFLFLALVYPLGVLGLGGGGL